MAGLTSGQARNPNEFVCTLFNILPSLLARNALTLGGLSIKSSKDGKVNVLTQRRQISFPSIQLHKSFLQSVILLALEKGDKRPYPDLFSDWSVSIYSNLRRNISHGQEI